MTALTSQLPVDIGEIAGNLKLDPEGIWIARSQTAISYPEEGNANCLALEAGSFWFAHRSRCIRAVMQRFPPPGVLFDIGGGNGYVAADLQQAGLPVALVEPGRQGVLNARRRGVQTLVCASLEDAGFKAGSLPSAGLFDVLEHIADDGAFLQAICRLLTPGGRLYLTVPAFQTLWSVDDEYAGHHRRYTRAGLNHLLASAGLRVQYSTYFFAMLPLPIFLMRSLPSRLGLRRADEWDRYNQEHSDKPGLIGRMISRILGLELARVQRGQSIPTGGSILVVAEKDRV